MSPHLLVPAPTLATALLPAMSLTWSLQALLVRHEAYVAEAEKEKARMAEEIQQLTTDKKALEAKNASTIEENRNLLDQLECVNNAVSDSDVHIQSLTATLQSTQAELHKLNNLASRTDRLERELEQYEREQASLQAALACKTEGEKAMTLRWQEAERRLAAFEDQLETIERDAKQERERHVEMVGRMERQRVVEQELETASGRLRGAAAAKTMARDKHGSTVVSHFVKDILQDNANLQLGIVELREMLTTSNDEVERLRDQLGQFCPQDQLVDYNHPDANRLSTLSLGQEMSRANAQELHVHHHYHAPSDTSSRRQSQTLRRPKKKRQGLTSGIYAPSSARTPTSSVSGFLPFTPCSTAPSSSGSIMSQTAVTAPAAKNHPYRWSMQSGYTLASSIASSPPSTTYHAPSLFDRGFSDAGMDSSRPTTPDSEMPDSPAYHAVQCKRGSAGYFRNIPALPNHHGNEDDFPPWDQSSAYPYPEADVDLSTPDHGTILEENEQDLLATDGTSAHHNSSTLARFAQDDDTLSTSTTTDFQPCPHRRPSHESLISISGMDIHTLKSRPSQLLTGHSARSFSSQPVVCPTMAHAARPALTPRAASDTSHSLLIGMASDQRHPSTSNKTKAKAKGWIFGRWGSTPTPILTLSTPLADMKVQKTREAVSTSGPPSPSKILRPPGINQTGPVSGFGPEPRLPPEPIMTKLDEEALRESLSEA